MDLIRKKNASQLFDNDLRHAVYRGQLPPFQHVDRLHRFHMERASEF
eukprot:gene22268-28839_t